MLIYANISDTESLRKSYLFYACQIFIPWTANFKVLISLRQSIQKFGSENAILKPYYCDYKINVIRSVLDRFLKTSIKLKCTNFFQSLSQIFLISGKFLAFLIPKNNHYGTHCYVEHLFFNELSYYFFKLW